MKAGTHGSGVVLITGASSGMGQAVALSLIQVGYVVYCTARRVDRLKELEEAGGIPVYLNVTDVDSIDNCVQRIMAEHDQIDVLINNAGSALYGAVEDISIEEARAQFEVNVLGMAQVTKAVLPFMRQQRAGRIINMSSMAGKVYSPLAAWHHASKHAIEGWSDCLRIEVKQFGIKVIIIEPGIIKTEFGKTYIEPMMERSYRSPYFDMARSVAKTALDAFANGQSSPPEVVSDTVLKAIRTHTPSTRYIIGKSAWPSIMMRKWLGDRIYDNAILNQI